MGDTAKTFEPDAGAFLDVRSLDQISDGTVHCTAIALCDGKGRAVDSFRQGEATHFVFEFEVLKEIGVPCGGLELRDASGVVVHGKNSFQYDDQLPLRVTPGERLRFHQVVQLDLAVGVYQPTFGFASVDAASYQAYVSGVIGESQFHPREHCRVSDAVSFSVSLRHDGKLGHHGVADLPGESSLTVMPGVQAVATVPQRRPQPDSAGPAIVHVTHWKAGSQWIFKILQQCAPDRIVSPTLSQRQFLSSPILPGRVYPTVYVTKAQFDHANVPHDVRYFVIIRDLRDTLMSGYFSIKVSHPLISSELAVMRGQLEKLSKEEGLIYLIDNWLPLCAAIQFSWTRAGEPMLRYEDLLENDIEMLERLLLDRCRMPVERDTFRRIVEANRFESLSGRARGTQNVHAHERIGISGDWKNHFTDRVKKEFKMHYGGLLVATGYEPDLNW